MMSSDQPTPDKSKTLGMDQTTDMPAAGQTPPGASVRLEETGQFTNTPTDHGEEPRPDPTTSWTGRKLGKYDVRELLGRGGMGVVYKAFDPMIEREIALKILSESFASDPVALDRFLAEARAVGRVQHNNVAAIYEIGADRGVHFLAMEYLPGGSLADRLEQLKTLPVFEATTAIIDACRGIGAAHAAGLIHRDIKPANFLRSSDGAVKATDFGLAKTTLGDGAQLTQAGMVIGTPYYMSPEQCEARTLDPRSDIYALGATYFSLLSGQFPFQTTTNVPQLMYAHCHLPAPDPSTIVGSLPSGCTAIIAKAMAKKPDDRYANTAEMVADLEAIIATLSGRGNIPLPSSSSTMSMHTTATPAAEVPRRRIMSYLVIGLLGVIVSGVLGYLLYLSPNESSIPGIVKPTGEPIVVGVLHSMSGTMASSESVVVDATLFAIDELNDAGGLLGRPIKPIVVDGKSEPKFFASEAEKLVANPSVVAVFGCWTSASRKTVKPIFEKADHLLFYPVQYEGLETSPNIVYLGSAPNQQILPAVEYCVKTLGKKRFFLVGSDYVFPRAANAAMKDQFKELGATLAGETYIPLGGQDTQATIDAIRASKPEMILNTLNGDSNLAFFRALRAAGITSETIPTLSFSVGEQELRNLNLDDVKGDYAAWTYFETVKSPANQAFLEKFKAKFPQRRVTDPMEAAYVGVNLWAKAVAAAKSADPKAVRRAIQNETFDAPGGPTRVDPDTQHLYKTPRIGQIDSDGTIQIIWSLPEPIAPIPYPKTRTAADWKIYLTDLYTGWGDQWSAPKK